MSKMSGQFTLNLALEGLHLVIKIGRIHLSWSLTVFRKYHGNPLSPLKKGETVWED